MLPDNDDAGPLAAAFPKAARDHWPDVLLTLILFVAAALLTGRVWRFAFDDELITFETVRLHLDVLHKLIFYGRAGGINPALSFVFFTGLQQLGFSDPAMRLVSLTMSGTALALIEILTFALLSRGRVIPLHLRLITILLFALTPAAISVGDAIRWYPLFALAVALFLTLYLAGNSRAARIASGVMLGLAGSINFLAVFVALPFGVFRYGLEKRFRLRFDLAFWSATLVVGFLGIWAAYGVATRRFSGVRHTEFGHGRIEAIAQSILGFFGGETLSVTQAWAVLPAALLTAAAVFLLIDRRKPGSPVHLFLLMLCGFVFMSLMGFAKPRSFLYLAPLVVALQLLFLERQTAVRFLVFSVLLLLAPLGVAADLYHPARPFKREDAIPFASVVDFVSANEKTATLVVTTDDVLARELPSPTRCVSILFQNRDCFDPTRHYDAIFLIYGHTYRALPRTVDAALAGLPIDLRAGAVNPASPRALLARQLTAWLPPKPTARAHFGEDGDAVLKTRLTGTALDPWLLTADFYSLQRQD